MSGSSTTEPKRTPLYDRHKALGAKVIDFGGWAMPVQYPSGILEEHRTVRSACGVFDVSHMGEVYFRGARAGEAIQRLITNDIGRLVDGGALYSVACRPHGGIVDDLIVYREREDEFLIVINASNIEKDVDWFRQQTGAICTVDDVSAETGLIAVQGPRAVELVQSLSRDPVSDLRSFQWCRAEVAGIATHVARTGYTGEDGFEIFVAAKETVRLWDELFARGEAAGAKPIGLGARDTLRLEARRCLYGNDIDEEHTPHEAGLSWLVKGKGFIGEEALAKQKAEGIQRKLVGFVMRERGIARHGYPIINDKGEPIGAVTSGTTGPSVGVAIGLGYVPTALSQPGTMLTIDCRGKPARGEVVQGPFYTRERGAAP
jgi:aminomethyltransferase